MNKDTPLLSSIKNVQARSTYNEQLSKEKIKAALRRLLVLTNYNHVDYIPDYVLEQLFQKINYLHPEVQPFIWIAFKTGLRISDTLALKQDCSNKSNCVNCV